jgi:uncharacterized tellurite resistance protein B-like protein
MLDSLKRFFQERIAGGPAETATDPDQRLRVAAATLLVEVMRADPEVRDEERTVVRTTLQGTFGLSLADTEELVRLAEAEANAATSLYEFTSLVDKGFSLEEKKRIVELMWLVAFADSEKDPLEEHLIRRVAGLLHVPHPDFIDAKTRARGKSGG